MDWVRRVGSDANLAALATYRKPDRSVSEIVNDAPAKQRHIRVALLHNIVSPHVVPLFERLAQQPGIALKVYFLAESDRNRRWSTSIDRPFEYEILPHWALRLGRKDLYTLFLNPTVVSTLLRNPFDVLISVGWDSFAAFAGFLLCRVLRRPFILWSGSTVGEPSWRRTVSLPLVRLIVSGATSWIAYGTRAREYLVRLGASSERVYMAYNTVDVDWFRSRSDELRPHRDRIREELGLESGPVALYVGQLIVRKGAHDLLAAQEIINRHHPTSQLIFVGYGPLEAELRLAVAQRHIRGVHFVGHVPIGDLPRYYVAADAFVLPSHEEVWGLVLNEAAACSLPLVATDITGAVPDLIERGVNGQIVPVSNPARLASALQQAFEHSTAMGVESRRIISHRTFEQDVDAILGAIQAAVG
jgi:glycosyltransferase involved in cell wall biosynthesis